MTPSSNNTLSYREILVNLGYFPSDFGDSLRMRPIYRESDNPTSLMVNKGNGRWVDFGLGRSGSFEQLVQITLNLQSTEEAKVVLNSKFQFVSDNIKPQVEVKHVKIFDTNTLDSLDRDHSYWVKRGISLETVELFQGGVYHSGRMKGRYCIPIFNKDKKIVGFTGRALFPTKMKYKHLGAKDSWCFPTHLNAGEITKSKSVILIESPACVMALWDVGIKNTICLFGISCSITILNYLIQADPNKIYISLNNEVDNNSIGNNAAEKLEKKLLKYFDSQQVCIALPLKKDFADMAKEERLAWKEKYAVS